MVDQRNPGLKPDAVLSGLLNTHSYFSEGRGVSSPATLARHASERGYEAVALTDLLSVGGAVELQQHAEKSGIRALIGATVPLATPAGTCPVVLLCASRSGYRNLNRLITFCRYDGQESVTLAQLLEHSTDLFLLTGGRSGFPSQLLAARRPRALQELLGTLTEPFRDRLFIQLYFDHHPWDARRVRTLRSLARDNRLPAIAAPQIHYALPEDFILYDTLICAREGITVDTPHPRRPQTRANHLKTPREWAAVLSCPAALGNVRTLCNELHFSLTPKRMVPPRVRLPAGHTADTWLRELCLERLPHVYQGAARDEAREVLERELGIIARQGFPEFFLACREITEYCAAHGILASARGSAAASITCYLLGISRIDPLEYDLLFERFLFQGQQAAPDIDIDVSSERRDQVLAWIERHFGGAGAAACEAMVSNRITYRIRLALQDLGRAVGLPPPLRDQVSKVLGRDFGRLAPRRAREADQRISEVLGEAPVKEVLYRVLERMEKGHYRHFAPHSGGMILSEQPLEHYSPQYRSANGIRALQFDKDDVEWLGLIKLDVLSLRILSALERAVEEVERLEGERLDIWKLPDEPGVWDLIGDGDTMSLFQIESPGQMALSTMLKPRTMRELADQEAIHRPGPIQSGSRRPYIARKLGRERVTFVHPALEPILGRTHGVLLYQEQVVRIARHVAGMSWAEADRFRKKVQKLGDGEADELRAAFVAGVLRTVDATPAQARQIFTLCASFTGFGFAESHSASFARITYATAWLLLHYPAEWLAAFLTVHPGMWPKQTLRMLCRRRGIPVLGLDINRSRAAFRVEHLADGSKALRMSLGVVKGLSADAVTAIGWERTRSPFSGVQDFRVRTKLDHAALESLVRAGAFDALQPRRDALFEVYALQDIRQAGQIPLFSLTPPLPALPLVPAADALAWDLELTRMSSSELHPVDLLRAELRELDARPLGSVRAGPAVRTAGLIIGIQRPPTANGFAFVMIEDGEDLAQVVVNPALWTEAYVLLRDDRVLVVEGTVQVSGLYMSIQAQRLLAFSSPHAAGTSVLRACRRSGW
jgi:error-prone DNA polymerase